MPSCKQAPAAWRSRAQRPPQDELRSTLGPILGVGVLVILVMMVFKPGD